MPYQSAREILLISLDLFYTVPGVLRVKRFDGSFQELVFVFLSFFFLLFLF